MAALRLAARERGRVTGGPGPGGEASRRCQRLAARNMLPFMSLRDVVFSGSAPRDAARAGLEECRGCRGRVRERESGGKAHFYIEMGLPSHAALSEAGE